MSGSGSTASDASVLVSRCSSWPAIRCSCQEIERSSPTLDHLLTTNEFFVRLRRTARHQPATSLDRWWPERSAAARFPGVRPDGHALWTVHTRLATAGGPAYPVLFWLGSTQRETNLHKLLRADPPQITVAAATQGADPAGPVWMPVGGSQRLYRQELPSDHGPHAARNGNWRDGHLDPTDQRHTHQ
jgi:hypothetical protein